MHSIRFLYSHMTNPSGSNSRSLRSVSALELAKELRAQSPEVFGSTLCRRLKTWSAVLPMLLAGQSSSHQQLSAKSATNQSLSGSWVWRAFTSSEDSLACAGQGHSGARSIRLDGIVDLGPCERDPDFLVLPLRRALPGDESREGLCVLMLNGATDGFRARTGARLAGFVDCQVRSIEFRSFEIPDEAWLTVPVDVQTTAEHAWLLQCAVALYAVHGLADRAARVVTDFLRQRVLYGQPAISLAQVHRTLTEIELQMMLSELFARSALALESIAKKDVCQARALCWHARELLFAAMEQLGVLLGARSFVRSGTEGDFQLIQAVLRTTLLTFCAAVESRDDVLPLAQILHERADLFITAQPLLRTPHGALDRRAQDEVSIALQDYCSHHAVPRGRLSELLVQGLISRCGHHLGPVTRNATHWEKDCV